MKIRLHLINIVTETWPDKEKPGQFRSRNIASCVEDDPDPIRTFFDLNPEEIKGVKKGEVFDFQVNEINESGFGKRVGLRGTLVTPKMPTRPEGAK